MQALKDFTQQYSLSKTLRFELRPMGQTLEYIEKQNFLQEDERRATEYKKLKRWIDEYHRDFINEVLGSCSFEVSLLQEAYQTRGEIEEVQRKIVQQKKNRARLEKNSDLQAEQQEKLEKLVKEQEKQQEKLKKLVKEQEKQHKDMRQGIANQFSKASQFANLFKAGLIQGKKGAAGDLAKWALQQVQTPEIKELLEETLPYFAKFTGYLQGFYENRKNMYKAEDQNTAIAYRIVDVNWPKFCQNLDRWQQNKLDTGEGKRIEQDFTIELEGKRLDKFFSLEYFNQCLRQDDIDKYNTILGGKFLEGFEEKIKGINEYYNLQHQQQGIKGNRRTRLMPLYKQILGKKGSHSFVLPVFDNDRQMLEAIDEFYSCVLADPIEEDLLTHIKNFMQQFPQDELEDIYLRNDTGLTKISQALFDGDWAFIGKALELYNDKRKQKLLADKVKLTKKQKRSFENKADYLSIAEIEEALLAWKQEQENQEAFAHINGKCVNNYFRNFGRSSENNSEDFSSRISSSYLKLRDCLKGVDSETTDNFLLRDKDKIAVVKNFLDNVIELLHFLKPLSLRQKGEKDKEDTIVVGKQSFYIEFHTLFEELESIVPLYNKVRNRVTKKPYSEEKFKLNFENGNLLDGWDQNKELANTCILLLKDGMYYLGIINADHKKIWKQLPQAEATEDCYQKMVYKLVPGPNKMLPHVFLSKKGKQTYSPYAGLLENYSNETHKKTSSNFCLRDCHALIDYFKQSIEKHPEWGLFQFCFSPTESYKDISDFYREFEKQSYHMDFVDLPSRSVGQWVAEGKLYLFEIYNKDFSAKTKGRPNLSTLYWNMVFAPENLRHVDQYGFQHPLFKLNGEAEMFYRRHSLEPTKVEHPKGQKLVNKRHQTGKKKTFSYDIIKDRRYKQDKFFFHVPITINNAVDNPGSLNKRMLEKLAEDKNINIIGIDRGERHLAYYTVVNQKGKLLEQGTLNKIKTYLPGDNVVDYHNLLDEREKQRDQQQQSWQPQSQIKDLKKGYISQVVHKICTLIREYNAIVVLEDLNFGFKRGRFKIEKQVYQNLEKALIQKLNYLVFKDLPKNSTEPGSVLNGLQLCPEFESFRKLGKQSGILFYVPAAYTSKIDPLTGFSNLFTSKYLTYSSAENARSFLSQFRKVLYDKGEQCLRFDFCYKDFSGIKIIDNNVWSVYAKDQRLIYSPKDKKMQEISLLEFSEKTFSRAGIDYRHGGDLKEEILKQKERPFWKDLLFLLRSTLQLRNSCRAQGSLEAQDYILSPVKGEDGRFFDSRQAKEWEPCDADANGAYHIALKGLQYIGKIQNSDDISKVKLACSNQEWFDFVQRKPYLG